MQKKQNFSYCQEINRNLKLKIQEIFLHYCKISINLKLFYNKIQNNSSHQMNKNYSVTCEINKNILYYHKINKTSHTIVK